MAINQLKAEKLNTLMKCDTCVLAANESILSIENKSPSQVLKELFRIEISMCDTSIYNKYTFIKSSVDDHPGYVRIIRPIPQYDGWVVVSYIGDTLQYKVFYKYEEAKNCAFEILGNRRRYFILL
jgi:hypothetical protein